MHQLSPGFTESPFVAWISNPTDMNNEDNKEFESQKHCKDGLNCVKIQTGECRYFHQTCPNGIYCKQLKQRKCKYYHSPIHFNETEKFAVKYNNSNNNYNNDNIENGYLSNHSDIGLTSSEDENEIKDNNNENNNNYNDPSCIINKDFKCTKNKQCTNKSRCEKIPFTEGSSRYAYKGHYCCAAVLNYNKKFGQKCIVKKWKKEHIYDETFWDRDIRCSEIAQKLINKWNIIAKLNKKYRVLTPIRAFMSTPGRGTNVPNNVVAENERVIIEDYLDGPFEKWNSNSGWFGNENTSIQAFCHWTYHYTDGKLLFCDAQGIRTKNEYVITDPCILSWKGKKYGSADCGKDYIISWFEKHKCNKFCDKKWIKPYGQEKSSNVVVTEKSTFVWQTKQW